MSKGQYAVKLFGRWQIYDMSGSEPREIVSHDSKKLLESICHKLNSGNGYTESDAIEEVCENSINIFNVLGIRLSCDEDER